jgi:thioredoxin-dependent peroxiredoxin
VAFFGLIAATATTFAVSSAAGLRPAGVSSAMTAADAKVGDPAPPFSLIGSDGRTYRLADYTGKQAVVLAWFAKAFTSG